MTAGIDFFSKYVMGNIQILMGAYFLARFLQKKMKLYVYFMFAVFWTVLITVIPDGGIIEFLAYILLLIAGGTFACHTDWKSAVLYAALTVEIMQLCFGIVNSLSSILYPWMLLFDRKIAGTAFMLLASMASLLLTVFCYCTVQRYFMHFEIMKKQYVLVILTPILMLFSVDEYINSTVYGNVNIVNDHEIIIHTNHYQMFVIQFLGMASLFCILFAYEKLLQNFRLNTELSLLEQEEHSLNQYVEEAKARYEKTKSFRHDIKNHITVVREFLQNGKSEQALNYLVDMEDIAEELSFPCATNNPVVDILLGNKLGIAKSMKIDVCCLLHLPYPCFVRDIDFGIILSNALDNAIHACINIDNDAEKYIRVTGRVQGDFVLMEIENSFDGKGVFKRGTGLSNINRVAEKYHGTMSIKTQGTSFLLSILLLIPQHSENISRQIG
ncbi:MAG: GHKL domain-containing protein [Lachnospiraceae bacterium]|nr:GHKL domain-containing protein [Lachnospiraceae bacterium]